MGNQPCAFCDTLEYQPSDGNIIPLATEKGKEIERLMQQTSENETTKENAAPVSPATTTSQSTPSSKAPPPVLFYSLPFYRGFHRTISISSQTSESEELSLETRSERTMRRRTSGVCERDQVEEPPRSIAEGQGTIVTSVSSRTQ